MFTLQAEKREIFGKKLKAQRQTGHLPIVIYGHKKPPTSLFVSLLDFKKVLQTAGESSIVTLTVPTGKESVLIHDVTYHPISREPIHADLYIVEQDVALKLHVPVEYVGVSPAVKELGGTLVKVLHEIEIEALPKDLPAEITINIGTLATLESQILIRDLKLPVGVKVLNRSDEVVAAISVAKEEETETAPVDLSAIEVEKRGKELVADESGSTLSVEPVKSQK